MTQESNNMTPDGLVKRLRFYRHGDAADLIEELQAQLLDVSKREAVMILRYDAKLEAAESMLKEAVRMGETMSLFISGDPTQRGVQAAYEFRAFLASMGDKPDE